MFLEQWTNRNYRNFLWVAIYDYCQKPYTEFLVLRKEISRANQIKLLKKIKKKQNTKQTEKLSKSLAAKASKGIYGAISK